MAVVRRFTPEVRLKRLLSEGGGLTASDAVRRAEIQLDHIRADCLAGIDAKIERVCDLARGQSATSLEQCYVVSNEIYAEAGVFGLNELSAAAHSLCALLSVQDLSKIPLAAIKVHVDSMRVLRTPQVEGSDALRKAVLSELEALARRFALQS